MASPSPTPTSSAVQTPAAQAHSHSHACVLCARRKVKCDRVDPCTNCRKAGVSCAYALPVPQPRRPRKRAADAELLARLARYEDLMRQNGVDYAPYATTWVPSGLEKVEVDVGVEAEGEQPRSHPLPLPQHPLKSTGNDNDHDRPAQTSSAVPNASRCLWHDLPLELKYPPVQTLRAPDDPLLHPTPSLQSILAEAAAGDAPTLGALHPAPRHIFVLWQRFVDSVNPLTKIVHVPTLQPRVLDASGHPDTVQPPLHALLFAIYTLSVTAMSPGECESVFGVHGSDTKIVLMTRYRTATLRALVAADVLVTRDLEVLQALVLFLFADPESDLTNSLTGLAMRLGQRMGLHHVATNAKLSVFEQEMRIRLWWPLCGLAGRAGLAHASALKTALLELGDLRLPLNVNDADLHPDMAEAPRESESESDSARPTEMLCVRMKFEFTSWVRSSPATTQAFENIVRGSTVAKNGTGTGDGTGTETGTEPGAEAIRRIEAVYESKYVRHLDTRIPLHGLAHAMIQLALARMRFTLYHPRHHPRGRLSSNAATAASNEDTLFLAAVQMLEMIDYGLRGPFASHIFTYMTSPFQMDAYIYVLSDLRRRAVGERVAVAWRLVEGLYDAHPALVEDVARNTLYAALGDLALEAWTTRAAELRAELRTQGQGQVADADVVVPWFIRALRDKDKDKKDKDNRTQKGTDDSGFATMTMADPYTMALDGVGTLDDADAAWTYWEDFLRL